MGIVYVTTTAESAIRQHMRQFGVPRAQPVSLTRLLRLMRRRNSTPIMHDR